MADEQVLYMNPRMNWRIISCAKLWGFTGYEVEKKYDGFWHSMYDGEFSLGECFLYLKKRNIISGDEMKAQIQKWCK